MRITNGMMMRKYGKNLNINLGRMNETSTQIESGRRFQRGSQDPVRALKSLQIRRNLSALEQYGSNIDVADSWLANTEAAVSAIKNHADKAVDLILQGRNDTLAPEDRMIIATALRHTQEALLKDLNSQSSYRYLLGGANTKEVPFTVDKTTGHLLFNGEDVFEMGMPESGGTFTTYKKDEHDFESLQTKVYSDLTGEFKLKNSGEIVDLSTVFDMFTPGIAIIGVGPNNLYNLIGRIAFSFESEYKMESVTLTDGMDYLVNAGKDRMKEIDGPITSDDEIGLDSPYSGYVGGDGLFKRLQDAQLNALISLVQVGEKSNFVNFLKNRNEDYIYQAEAIQNKLEVMPPDEAIMLFKMQDYVYKACLQMGTYIFQPSLMDYIKR